MSAAEQTSYLARNLKDQKEVILLTYDTILGSLRTALYPWLAKPKIVPVSFHIEFKKNSWEQPAVEFAIGNGALESKLVALTRTNLVVLHYAFKVHDQGQEIGRGLLKIRVSK